MYLLFPNLLRIRLRQTCLTGMLYHSCISIHTMLADSILQYHIIVYYYTRFPHPRRRLEQACRGVRVAEGGPQLAIRLALPSILVKDFKLYSFQLQDIDALYCYSLSLPPCVRIG